MGGEKNLQEVALVVGNVLLRGETKDKNKKDFFSTKDFRNRRMRRFGVSYK